MVHCREMLSELAQVLYRPPFDYPADEVVAVVSQYRQLGVRVEITGALHVVTDDPDDDKVIEYALVAGASYIISRNRHLLKIVEYEGVQIVTPEAFLALLDAL
jgi:uncharacterized protein